MRLSNTNNFSASFNVATPYQMVVIHSSKLIYPRELYQRGIQRKRVELIARDFNEYTANEPKISFRNGRPYPNGEEATRSRNIRLKDITSEIFYGPPLFPSETDLLHIAMGVCEQRGDGGSFQLRQNSYRFGSRVGFPE